MSSVQSAQCASAVAEPPRPSWRAVFRRAVDDLANHLRSLFPNTGLFPESESPGATAPSSDPNVSGMTSPSCRIRFTAESVSSRLAAGDSLPWMPVPIHESAPVATTPGAASPSGPAIGCSAPTHHPIRSGRVTTQNLPPSMENQSSDQASRRHRGNPLFPALRSAPTAVSGASRQKQIPSSKKNYLMRSVVAMFAYLNIACAQAFPPAPYYRLFGVVRDQVGQTIRGDNVEVVLLKGDEEVGRASVSSIMIDHNYQLDVRIDHGRAGTASYSENAIAAGGQFSLAVSMNGQWFYPIEVSGNLTAGKGGERIRLDLTLGEDSDRDGLPDMWESWQLYDAGIDPDGEGVWDLSLLDKDGDFDGDGQNNWLEYVAGTFAGDATENFSLQIKEKLASAIRFEFFAITGKVYTLEATRDMKSWRRVPFALSQAGSEINAHQATEIGVISAFTTSDEHPNQFYRLSVR